MTKWPHVERIDLPDRLGVKTHKDGLVCGEIMLISPHRSESSRKTMLDDMETALREKLSPLAWRET